MTADPILAAKEREEAVERVRVAVEKRRTGADRDLARDRWKNHTDEDRQKAYAFATVPDLALSDLMAVFTALAEARRQLADSDEARNILTAAVVDRCAERDEVRRRVAERDEALRGLRGWMPMSGITPECDHAMRVADALLASPPGEVEIKPVTMLVGQDWLSRHVATDPDASVESGLDVLAWLSENRNVELSFDYGDADDDGKGWVVHRVNGGINDREWTLIGSGSTPLEALMAARALTSETPHAE